MSCESLVATQSHVSGKFGLSLNLSLYFPNGDSLVT